MANPLIVTLTKNTWVKVATSVTTGMIWKLSPCIRILQTYRMTGQAAPVALTDGAQIFHDNSISMPISASAAIDVYLYSFDNDEDVRVDL